MFDVIQTQIIWCDGKWRERTLRFHMNFIQLLFGLPATSTAVSNIDGGIATTMPTTETSQPASTALPAGSHHQAADDGMPGHSAPVHNVMYFGM